MQQSNWNKIYLQFAKNRRISHLKLIKIFHETLLGRFKRIDQRNYCYRESTMVQEHFKRPAILKHYLESVIRHLESSPGKRRAKIWEYVPETKKKHTHISTIIDTLSRESIKARCGLESFTRILTVHSITWRNY